MSGQSFMLDPKDAAHVSGPLRLVVGDRILVNDGSGQRVLCELTKVDNKQVRVQVFERLVVPTKGFSVTLFQGLIKGSRMDLVIEKATELGVDAIVPISTERTVVKGDSTKFGKKVERWQRLAEEAAKQSKRVDIPVIRPVMTFALACGAQSDLGLDKIIVPWEEESVSGEPMAPPLFAGSTDIGLFIGPEGGFAEKEIDLLKDAGATTVSLGPTILRAETAAIISVALVMNHATAARPV